MASTSGARARAGPSEAPVTTAAIATTLTHRRLPLTVSSYGAEDMGAPRGVAGSSGAHLMTRFAGPVIGQMCGVSARASRRHLAPVVTVLALIALAVPGVSRAGCGGTQIAYARAHPRGQLPPLAIGDSTMLLSLPGLSAAGWTANAHGCRTVRQALGILGHLRARRELPHMVAIALGSNGGLASPDIDEALRLICCGRILVLVTPRELGGGSGPPAAIERSAAHAHRDRVLLLDWVADSAGHPQWFQPDRLHLTLRGVAAFNALLSHVLPYAYSPCPPTPRRHAGARADHRRQRSPTDRIS
jgi:hypothetical protein